MIVRTEHYSSIPISANIAEVGIQRSLRECKIVIALRSDLRFWLMYLASSRISEFRKRSSRKVGNQYVTIVAGVLL